MVRKRKVRKMEKHSCKTCDYCRQKIDVRGEKIYTCTLFEDSPEVDIWVLHFCGMYKKRDENE